MHHGWRHDDVITPVTYWYRSNVEEEYKKDEIRQKLWNFKNEKITTFYLFTKNTVSKTIYLPTKSVFTIYDDLKNNFSIKFQIFENFLWDQILKN